MTNLSLKQKLKNGENVYGTCVTATGAIWPSVAKRAGLDFVFLDTEHIPLGRNELAVLCQQFRALDITPIVRIPNPDPFLACQAIDGGALGVVAPYIESRDQILELVGATKYRPLKGDLLYKHLYEIEPISAKVQEYVDNLNKDHLCIANIESVPALDRLDEILSVPGLDAVFIGPHDLSVSLGIPEEYNHPEFEKAVTTIIQQTRAKGLAIGIHFSLEPERQIQWMKVGVNIVVHSFDIALFSQRLKFDMDLIRAAAGDRKSLPDNSPTVI